MERDGLEREWLIMAVIMDDRGPCFPAHLHGVFSKAGVEQSLARGLATRVWPLPHRAARAALGGQWLLILGLQRLGGLCPLWVRRPWELPCPPGVCAPGWSCRCWTLPLSPGLGRPTLSHGSVS